LATNLPGMCYIRDMTANEFAVTLESLGMTRARIACLLGVSERGVYHYVSGDRPVPPLTAAVLRLLRSGRITPTDLGEAG
jgi:predicted transcriptional regulator